MTCREKLAIEQPTKIDKCYVGGCYGCPHEYGYLEKPTYCSPHENSCIDCWDRELPNETPKEEFESCEDCVHVSEPEWEEPCCNCKHGIPYSDPKHATAPSYYIPQNLVLPKEHMDNDPVNHPSHYTNGGMECIDEMLLIFGKTAVKNFCLLNAWKYRKRALHKNGQEDLDKADWYLKKYKELVEDGTGK